MSVQDLSKQLYSILKEAAENSTPLSIGGSDSDPFATLAGGAARLLTDVSEFLDDPVGKLAETSKGHAYYAWSSLQAYYPSEQRALFRRPNPQLGVLVVPVGALADGLGVNEIAHTAPCLVYPDGSVVRVDAGPVIFNNWSKLQVTYETGQIPGNGLFVPLLEGPEAKLAKHANRLLIIAQHVNSRNNAVYDLLAGNDSRDEANMNCNKFTATAYIVLDRLALINGEDSGKLGDLKKQLAPLNRTIHGTYAEEAMVQQLTTYVFGEELSQSRTPQTKQELLKKAANLMLPNGLPPGSEGNSTQTPPPAIPAFMGIEAAIGEMLETSGLSSADQNLLRAATQQSSQNKGLAPVYDLQDAAQKATEAAKNLFRGLLR